MPKLCGFKFRPHRPRNTRQIAKMKAGGNVRFLSIIAYNFLIVYLRRPKINNYLLPLN